MNKTKYRHGRLPLLLTKQLTHRIILMKLLFFMAFGLLMSQPAMAQYEDHELKGGWVYNFARFVTWPDKVFKNKDVIVLGILGDDPFRGVLELIVKNRSANGRRIVIKRWQNIRELKGSHIVFVSKSEEYHIEETMKEVMAFNSYGVLTIGDGIENFCELGGMINFNEGRPTFNINWVAASNAGLLFNPKLLKMAEEIISHEE